MKLKTRVDGNDGGYFLAMDCDSVMRYRDQLEHDAVAAHALKQAEREADALFNASTRWFRARAWINTRADELMAEWGFDTRDDA